jgi:uncharacterized membrane protein YuzA (DUF378 family)
MKKLAWVLVIVGALNWGLVGLGGLFFDGEINLVSIIFGAGSMASYVVYLLVGISAVLALMGHCGCKGCSGSSCKDCANGACDAHKR